MCGITGFFAFNASGSFEFEHSLKQMTSLLQHRGPDDTGQWIDRDVGIAFGHTRLSILDTSPSGHQPMVSPSGRYVIAFNGEIYNHSEIRNDIEKRDSIVWCGHSDTEVILAAIDFYGVEAAIKQFVGMFAFAVWDRKCRCLYLVRDRLGEKPLYYGWMGDVFLFGSELKSLKAHPAWSGQINRAAVALLMRHNYIPAPHSIYHRIYKLLPGSFLTVDAAESPVSLNPVAYWSAKSVAEEGVADPFTGNEIEAIDRLDGLLRDAVGLQMVADVPLGTFLSGGIDSSIITALMQVQSSDPVRTFTIGFNEEGYNEAVHAKAVAKHIGTEHTEFYVSPKDALSVIPKLPCLYDEPFSDSSQIPTYLVSQLTRKHVTVSLSGDGGDELFAGYNRYFWAQNIWGRIKFLPRPLRHAFEKSMTNMSPQVWDKLFQVAGPLLPQGFQQRNPGDKLHKLAELMTVSTPEEMYHRLVSHWKKPASLVLGSEEPLTVLTDKSLWPELTDFTQLMQYLDMVSYLPDDILTKVDRAAMGTSLETRVPFLDHRVVEFAWRIPLSMKIRNGQGKWLLRQVLYRYVPKELIDRPKAGFAIPI